MRPLLLSATLVTACHAPPARLVDQVDGHRAVLIEQQTGRVLVIARADLGPDAGEGAWLGEPDAEAIRETRARRARLGAADDGRDLQLQR